jgi:hypothetical protein
MQHRDYFFRIMVIALAMHPTHQTQSNHLGIMLAGTFSLDIRLVLAP